MTHCWHSSCSPWSIPPPLPLPSYSSLSISSNICCTCRDAALSNSCETEKQKETETQEGVLVISLCYDTTALWLKAADVSVHQIPETLWHLNVFKSHGELQHRLKSASVCVCGQASSHATTKKQERDEEEEEVSLESYFALLWIFYFSEASWG